MILNARSFKESVHMMGQIRYANVKKITRDQLVQVLRFFLYYFQNSHFYVIILPYCGAKRKV